MYKASTPRRHNQGFTLMELMIAVVIVGIITAIALPAYQAQLMRARRTDAKTALLDLASREEKYFAINNQYTTLASLLGYSSSATPLNQPVVSSSNSTIYYVLTVTLPAANPPSFQGAATPQGPQLRDTECGTFWLDNTGAKTTQFSGASCW